MENVLVVAAFPVKVTKYLTRSNWRKTFIMAIIIVSYNIVIMAGKAWKQTALWSMVGWSWQQQLVHIPSAEPEIEKRLESGLAYKHEDLPSSHQDHSL